MASAVAWKRLFPNGKADQNVGGRGKKTEAKNCLSFEDFAKQSFKVNHLYAKQALAIANYSPELLEAAKESMEGWGENPERIEALIRDDVEVLAMWL